MGVYGHDQGYFLAYFKSCYPVKYQQQQITCKRTPNSETAQKLINQQKTSNSKKTKTKNPPQNKTKTNKQTKNKQKTTTNKQQKETEIPTSNHPIYMQKRLLMTQPPTAPSTVKRDPNDVTPTKQKQECECSRQLRHQRLTLTKNSTTCLRHNHEHTHYSLQDAQINT